MKKMKIYEPAMCCETGLCGVGVDPELLRISTVINALKKQGIVVERYNLNNAPDAFIESKAVNAYLMKQGVEGLPITLVEDMIVLEGRYPLHDEILEFLDLPAVSMAAPAIGKVFQKDAVCACSEVSVDTKKRIVIQYLSLDAAACERCMNTDQELERAVQGVRPVLEELGYQITLQKVVIQDTEMAQAYRFLTSPTILVNGIDIFDDIQESACKECSDICGADVTCRSFHYCGKQYEYAPKAFLMDRILRALYTSRNPQEVPYEVPENLKTFFAAKKKPSMQQKCCCSEQRAVENNDDTRRKRNGTI